ncbi:GAF domain-containing sensor histidine kinase [Saccharopolyspora tripterygii]
MKRRSLGMADAEQESHLLIRIIETISARLDLDEIVQNVAAIITEMTATDVCFVHLLDDDRQRLKLCGATPPFDRLAGQVELAVGEGMAGWVAAHGEPAVIVEDKLADPRYKYIPELHGEEFTSMVSVPILTRLGHLVGVLNLHSKRRREFGDDVELLRSLAGLVAGAIENARLYRRLADREEALERFTERMVQLQEAESRRLAGEIHDGISQRIVSLFFHLSAARDLVGDDSSRAEQQIATAQDLAAAALDETRYAIAGLRPPVLDDLGLTASLQSLASGIADLRVRVDAGVCDVPEFLESAIYRSAQEALQNIQKHAQAGSAVIRLRATSAGVVLQVSDDGVGFDPASLRVSTGPTGHGLSGLRERARLLGGTLDVRSTPGEGTTLTLNVPPQQDSS